MISDSVITANLFNTHFCSIHKTVTVDKYITYTPSDFHINTGNLLLLLLLLLYLLLIIIILVLVDTRRQTICTFNVFVLSGYVHPRNRAIHNIHYVPSMGYVRIQLNVQSCFTASYQGQYVLGLSPIK